jgi:hypothetical protein
MTTLSEKYNKELEVINHDRFASFAIKVAERYKLEYDLDRYSVSELASDAMNDIMFYYSDNRFAEDEAVLKAHPEATHYFVTHYLNSVID